MRIWTTKHVQELVDAEYGSGGSPPPPSDDAGFRTFIKNSIWVTPMTVLASGSNMMLAGTVENANPDDRKRLLMGERVHGITPNGMTHVSGSPAFYTAGQFWNGSMTLKHNDNVYDALFVSAFPSNNNPYQASVLSGFPGSIINAAAPRSFGLITISEFQLPDGSSFTPDVPVRIELYAVGPTVSPTESGWGYGTAFYR